jgi:hypothetical protein
VLHPQASVRVVALVALARLALPGPHTTICVLILPPAGLCAGRGARGASTARAARFS